MSSSLRWSPGSRSRLLGVHRSKRIAKASRSNVFRITRVLVVIGSITILLLLLTMWSQFHDLSTDDADSSYEQNT